MDREALIKAACRPYLAPAMSPEEYDAWWSRYGHGGALRGQVAAVVDAVLTAQEEDAISHDALWAVCRTDDLDYEPYGRADRNGFFDCSCGCRFYAELPWPRGADWGVCTNPASHRAGLLTFEHQGCPHFQAKANYD
jgi:hypothetical protein